MPESLLSTSRTMLRQVSCVRVRHLARRVTSSTAFDARTVSAGAGQMSGTAGLVESGKRIFRVEFSDQRDTVLSEFRAAESRRCSIRSIKEHRSAGAVFRRASAGRRATHAAAPENGVTIQDN